MKKIRYTAALLVSALLLTSCGAADKGNSEITQADENEIQASESVEERTELWIEIGEKAYREGTVPDFDASAYFKDNSATNTVITLYDDMYYYDRDSFEPVAALLYRYIRDTHGEDALTDLEKRVQYKDEWMKTLDASFSYVQDPRIEKILSGMSCTETADYRISAELDGVKYNFYDYDSSVTPNLVHLIIYHASEGLSLLRSELQSIDPDGVIFDTSAPVSYVMSFSGDTVMLPDGSYSIGKYEDILAAAVMMMAENDDPKAHWITEGLAEIYGKARGYYFLTVYDRVFYLHPSTADTLRKYADAGEAVGIYHLSASDYFYGAGGTIVQDNIPEPFSDICGYTYFIDGELYTHAAALANIGCGYMPGLGSLYTVRSDGGDLSRIEAGSFVLRLMENYKISDILAVCRDYSKLEEVFGMSYDELHADWTAWLSAKFE